MEEQVFIGRQPILDRQQRIIGYELLFRHDAQAATAEFSDDLSAGTRVLVNALAHMGVNRLLGDRLAFINVSSSLLHSGFLELLPAESVVLEIPESVEAAPEVLQRCRELRALGFRFALDDYRRAPETGPLLEIASYAKLDVQRLGRAETAAQVRAMKKYPVEPIAGKVETKEEFNFCRELGLPYFQGFYFARPETLGAKAIHPAYQHVLELMKKVHGNAEIREIEEAFRKDGALSFKILRYINSVGFGLSCEIQSIRHALTILGYRQLYRWLTLLLVTSREDATPPALMKTAITRGRLTELLGQEYLSGHELDNLFIVGVFSLLDAMLGMPMEDILGELTLPAAVSDALLCRGGVYAPFLELAEACEGVGIERIDGLARQLQLVPEKVSRAHLAALAWVEDLGI